MMLCITVLSKQTMKVILSKTAMMVVFSLPYTAAQYLGLKSGNDGKTVFELNLKAN